MVVEADENDYIFSDQGDPIVLTAGDTELYSGVFSESTSGNGPGDGGFVSASGYYVGWDGESTIGVHTGNVASLALFGDGINCVIVGLLQLIKQ